MELAAPKNGESYGAYLGIAPLKIRARYVRDWNWRSWIQTNLVLLLRSTVQHMRFSIWFLNKSGLYFRLPLWS